METYITTDELATRIHYDARTIRTRLKDAVLLEGVHYIRPFGAAGKQSLQDYLVNRRVDAAFRDRVPLLCRGSEVLLVGGVGAGGVPDARNENEFVMLRWAATFPWQRERK